MNRNKKGSATPKVAGNMSLSKPKLVRAPRKQASVAAAYATGQSSGQAQIYRDSVNSCRIRHRELITSLSGSVNFTVANNFSVNPGLATSFPWLSIEAQGWEKYHFNSLKLCYYTRTGSNVPGSVILAADYDAADAAPVSEQIASAYYGTEEDAPWKDICFTFDPRRLAGERFVRIGGLSANLDVKTYDVANAFVCTTDGTAVNWGKVWFEYDVTLFNPQLPPGGPSGSGTLVSAGGSIAAATPFGSVPLPTGSYSMNAAATNVITFSGLSIGTEYLLSYSIVGTVITALSAGSLNGLSGKSLNNANCINAAATAAALLETVTATATSGSVTLSVTATTVTQGFVTLTAITPAASL